MTSATITHGTQTVRVIHLSGACTLMDLIALTVLLFLNSALLVQVYSIAIVAQTERIHLIALVVQTSGMCTTMALSVLAVVRSATGVVHVLAILAARCATIMVTVQTHVAAAQISGIKTETNLTVLTARLLVRIAVLALAKSCVVLAPTMRILTRASVVLINGTSLTTARIV